MVRIGSGFKKNDSIHIHLSGINIDSWITSVRFQKNCMFHLQPIWFYLNIDPLLISQSSPDQPVRAFLILIILHFQVSN